MRRIDLSEIPARWPGALEWYDISCKRLHQHETRFYERLGPTSQAEREIDAVTLVKTELVATASVPRAKPKKATYQRKKGDDRISILSTEPRTEVWDSVVGVWRSWTANVTATPYRHARAILEVLEPRFEKDEVLAFDGGGRLVSTSDLEWLSDNAVGDAIGQVISMSKIKKRRGWYAVSLRVFPRGEAILRDRGLEVTPSRAEVEVVNVTHGRDP